MDNPGLITIFISPKWKYEVYNLVMEGKDVKQIMPKYKQYGKNVVGYIQKLKRLHQLEELFYSPGSELKAVKGAKEFLEKMCGCEVVIASEQVDHPKKNSTEPGKPGILLE